MTKPVPQAAVIWCGGDFAAEGAAAPGASAKLDASPHAQPLRAPLPRPAVLDLPT